MKIDPDEASTNRKIAVVRVDFPAPVRPTIPTFKEKSDRTHGFKIGEIEM